MNKIDSNTRSADNNRTGFLQLLKTAAAAAFGVQSDKNRQADFSQNTVIPYILVGILFTAAFLATLILIVSFVV